MSVPGRPRLLPLAFTRLAFVSFVCSSCASCTSSPRLIRSFSLLEIGGRDPAWWCPRLRGEWRSRLLTRLRRERRCRLSLLLGRECVADPAVRDGECRLSLSERERRVPLAGDLLEREDRRPPQDLLGDGLALHELELREVEPLQEAADPLAEVVLPELVEESECREWRRRRWPMLRCADRWPRREQAQGAAGSSAAEDRSFSSSPSLADWLEASSEGWFDRVDKLSWSRLARVRFLPAAKSPAA